MRIHPPPERTRGCGGGTPRPRYHSRGRARSARGPSSVTRVLSFHADYRCGNSGACCTADWPIPVEADRLSRMQAALASGLLQARDGIAEPLLFLAGAPIETPAVLATRDHACGFYDGAAGRPGCRVQHALGHEALPLACRQFPR